jgi:hypothetical protein
MDPLATKEELADTLEGSASALLKQIQAIIRLLIHRFH